MICRAKVNLTLHVGAAITDGRFQGYHPLESLVVFADIGDRLTFEPADGKGSMEFTGPFGNALYSVGDNSIWKALRLCEAPPQHVIVEKNIPIAAGLGGGTADAAGVLRKFDPAGEYFGLEIGADGPVCRLSRTAMMEGIGAQLTPLPGLGCQSAVLANPGIQISTADIFKAFDAEARSEQPASTAREGTLLDRTLSGRNDLEAIAIDQAPVIADVIQAMSDQPGCEVSRMSGSGASVFGLFDHNKAAQSAAAVLSARGWWAVATRLGDPS